MIISETQIMQLIYFASAFRTELLIHKTHNKLTDDGKNQLDQINNVLTMIYNQQSAELKEIK